jgi:hypothetical protein
MASAAGTQVFLDEVLAHNTATSGESQRLEVFFYSHDFDRMEEYFWQDVQGFQRIQSDGGQHNLRFEGTRKIFVAGGIFDFCACRAVRDVLRFYRAPDRRRDDRPLEIIYVQDAIYVNNFEVESRWASDASVTTTLEDITEKLSDEELLAFVEREYFRNRRTGMCDDYKDPITPGTDMLQRYAFHIERDSRRLGTLTDIRNRWPYPEVTLRFISVRDLGDELKGL